MALVGKRTSLGKSHRADQISGSLFQFQKTHTTLLLIAANLLIFFGFCRFLNKFITGLLNSSDLSQIESLIYWDIFVFLFLAGLLLFFANMILVRSKNGKIRSAYFFNHPVRLFIIATPLLALFFIYLPTILMDFIFNIPLHPYHFFRRPFQLPSFNHIWMSVITAFSIGLSWADHATKNPRRWWLLPFLAAPLPGIYWFPLLWWNAMARFLPSRIWTFWRPVLTLLSCMLPVLFFPQSQEIRPDYPQFGRGESVSLTNPDNYCEAYGIQWKQGDLYMHCSNNLVKVSFDDSMQNPHFVDTHDFEFFWNFFAIDNERSLIHIYDGQGKVLYTEALDDFHIENTRQIPRWVFPTKSERPFLNLDEKRNNLIVTDQYGYLALIDLDDPHQQDYITRYLYDGQEIVGTHFDGKRDQLAMMQKGRFSILDPETFESRREFSLSEIAFSFTYDSPGNQVFISYPGNAEVEIRDLDTFAVKRTINGPLGVRRVVVDHENNRVILTSLTGVVELRDGQDFSLIDRIRLAPRIHGVSAWPEKKRLAVAFGHNSPAIVDYSDLSTAFDPLDTLLRGFEKFLSFAMPHLSKRATFSREFQNDFSQNRTETVPKLKGRGNVYLLGTEKAVIEQGADILKWGGFTPHVVASIDEARMLFEKQPGSARIVLVDFNLFPNQDMHALKRQLGLEQNTPVCLFAKKNEIILMGNYDDSLIIRSPFRFAEFLSKVTALSVTGKN